MTSNNEEDPDSKEDRRSPWTGHERRLNMHAERIRSLEDFRLLHQQTEAAMRESMKRIEDHLGSQDEKLDGLKTTISRWAGAVAVIVALPAVFAIIWTVTHTKP